MRPTATNITVYIVAEYEANAWTAGRFFDTYETAQAAAAPMDLRVYAAEAVVNPATIQLGPVPQEARSAVSL